MKLLFCPLSSPGFSFAALSVARGLAARGHEITFAGDPWLIPLIQAALPGAAPVQGAPAAFQTSRWHQPQAVAGQVALLERIVAERRPDVIVTSALALGPLIVGERAGRPVAVIGLLTELLPEEGSRRQEFQAAFDAARAACGHGPAPARRMEGDLLLRPGVPALGAGPRAIGCCAWEPAAPRAMTGWLAAARAEGRRVVYVQQARSFGAPGFWPGLAEALPPDVRVAASTSRMEAAPEPAPRGALIAPMVPQGLILDHAAAVLCSGTTSVAVAAMARGVPIVAVPGGGEQHAVAALIERHGLGVSVEADRASPAALSAALQAALDLDPAPRQRIRDGFAAIDGPQRAADVIESLSFQLE